MIHPWRITGSLCTNERLRFKEYGCISVGRLVPKRAGCGIDLTPTTPNSCPWYVYMVCCEKQDVNEASCTIGKYLAAPSDRPLVSLVGTHRVSAFFCNIPDHLVIPFFKTSDSFIPTYICM